MKTILCPLDLHESTRVALPHVAAWAKRFDASVVLFHAVDFHQLKKYGYPFDTMSEDAIEAKARAATHDYLQALIDHPVMEGVRASIDVRFAWGLAETIADVAADTNADLLLLANSIHTVVGRLALGSVVEQSLHRTERPLLICNAPDGEIPPVRHAPPSYDRIVVGCDLSETSQRAVDAAHRLAEVFDASIDLVHVNDERRMHGDHAASGADLAKHEQRVLAALTRLAEPLRTVEHRVHGLVGRPEKELLLFANKVDADLIVVTTRGHESVADHILGSTAERILRRAACPVYIEHG